MPKLEDSAKGEKSFGVMIYEPPYTRPAWPVLTKEGSGGVRRALRHLMVEPIHSITCLAFLSSNLLALGKTYSFVIFGLCFGLSELQMCMALSVGYFSVSIFHSIVFNLSATTFNVFSISFSDGNSPKTNSLKLVS
jgi:hypothetical protein